MRELKLRFNNGDSDQYTVGTNCSSIERDPAGGWFVLRVGQRLWVPDWMCTLGMEPFQPAAAPAAGSRLATAPEHS